MVGSFLTKGMPPKGEAKIALQEVISTQTRYAEQVLERDRIPNELKEIPKRYFEKILQE